MPGGFSDCSAGGEWGEKAAYRWSAKEPVEDIGAMHGPGFARLESGIIAEQWLRLTQGVCIG